MSTVRRRSEGVRVPRHIWLLVGTVLALFAVHGKWDVAIAAWLYPIFLLRFARTGRVLSGFAWTWLSGVLTTLFWLVEAESLWAPTLILYVLGLGTVLGLPVLADRLITPGLAGRSGLAATLVFPVARVTAEFLIAFVSPFGTIFGVLGLTQHGNLPLIQVVSVTGVYGVSFLVAWLAPVVNLAWENAHALVAARTAVCVYLTVLGVVLAGGGLRVAFSAPSGDVVRVAGISPSESRRAQMLDKLDALGLEELKDYSAANPSTMRRAFSGVLGDLLRRSAHEARAGAKVITWSEASAFVTARDRDRLVHRVERLARRYGVYLDVGLEVFTPSAPYLRNQTMLVTPQGVAWTYDKAHPVPVLEPMKPGDGVVPVADTPYGRLANVICYDAAFPELMRQVGAQDAGIMLVPANTWEGIEKLYVEMVRFRAIEGGYAVVNQASGGLARTFDHQGRTLASSAWSAPGDRTMVAFVPTQGTATVYSRVGDVLAWLCVAALLVLAGVAGRGRRRGRHDEFPASDTIGGRTRAI